MANVMHEMRPIGRQIQMNHRVRILIRDGFINGYLAGARHVQEPQPTLFSIGKAFFLALGSFLGLASSVYGYIGSFKGASDGDKPYYLVAAIVSGTGWGIITILTILDFIRTCCLTPNEIELEADRHWMIHQQNLVNMEDAYAVRENDGVMNDVRNFMQSGAVPPPLI